jgi:hypothetical protein
MLLEMKTSATAVDAIVEAHQKLNKHISINIPD